MNLRSVAPVLDLTKSGNRSIPISKERLADTIPWKVRSQQSQVSHCQRSGLLSQSSYAATENSCVRLSHGVYSVGCWELGWKFQLRSKEMMNQAVGEPSFSQCGEDRIVDFVLRGV